MCGIAGYFNPDQNYAENPKQNFHTLSRMINTMNHRGPDTYGHTIINSCCLAHTRLSIIDLENGRQPMSYTKDGNTYYIVYNGEIYNYQTLREELIAAGHTFTTKSDTEVLLHGYEQWGGDLLQRGRDLGQEQAGTVRRARPFRHQALLLCEDERHVHVRVGDQEPVAPPRFRQGAQRRGVEAVYDLPVSGDR